MIIRETQLTVLPDGEPIFSELATSVRIEDEAAGEFVVVSQEGTPGYGKIAIDRSDWPVLREAIDRMINSCMV
jgi:hypothetical protein